MAERRVEMHLNLARGRVHLRETAPGTLILSWHPHEQDDEHWPGQIIEIATRPDFPEGPALEGDSVAVQDWVEAQEWAQITS